MMSGDESSPTTILLIDDSLTDRVRGAGLIQAKYPTWRVLQATSGPQGLEQLAANKVNTVVCDLVMPGMDGRQFLRTANERFPNTPVVLVTSHGDDQIAAECVETGAVNYVPKRLLAERLLPVIEEVVNSQREAAAMQAVLKHVERNRCEFEIDNDLNQIRSLANFVSERLRGFNRFSGETVQAMSSAVRESLLNAYFHGNLECNSQPLQHDRAEYTQLAAEKRTLPGLSGRHIRFSMQLDRQRILFRVADDGPGFDTSVLDELTGAPAEGNPRGNGVRRMREAMDTVLFSRTGNEVLLSRQCPPFSEG
ncbi:MAG: response regulator [Planctomycetaceae bacterium]|nr:response regulator [Planctomycetaceae bacterium]